MKITLWDDDESAAKEWEAKIVEQMGDAEVAVRACTPNEIAKDLGVLHARRKCYLSSGGQGENQTLSMLDDTDILFVDTDLFDLPTFVDFSAEIVAGRALVYTTCPYIVVLNANPDIDFDLSLLGNPNSKANLHINDRFISHEGLWLRCPLDGGEFRPWQWPLLQMAITSQRLRATKLKECFDVEGLGIAVLDYFSFSPSARERLSRSARAFLHPRKEANNVSFEDFISNNVKAIDSRDATRIVEKGDTEKLAWICSHRLAKWLSHLVAGPQDILMDLPHLVSEFPFLLQESERACRHSWNRLAELHDTPVDQLTEDISQHQFGLSQWFDRPMYWRHGFDSEDNLDKLIETAGSNDHFPVFCEDSSSFHWATECTRFVAGYHSVSDNRFIRWFEGDDATINYGPYSRMAM